MSQTLPEVIRNKILGFFSELEKQDTDKSGQVDEQMLTTIISKSLEESFVEVDNMLRQKLSQDTNLSQSQTGKVNVLSLLEKHSGSTAVCALIVSPTGGDRHLLFVANAGDSRAVLGKYSPGEQPQVESRRLSFDHKPLCPQEEERIRRAGGYVSENGRVNGNLAVARSLGDYYLYPMVISEPHIAPPEIVRTSSTAETPDFNNRDFLIIACDGIFDVVDDQLACATVAETLTQTGGRGEFACARLRDLAFSYGSDDNISVILIQF